MYIIKKNLFKLIDLDDNNLLKFNLYNIRAISYFYL